MSSCKWPMITITCVKWWRIFRLMHFLPKVWCDISTSVWHNLLRNSVQTHYLFHVQFYQLCTYLHVVLTDIKWATLVNWSTITQIESYHSESVVNPQWNPSWLFPPLTQVSSKVGVNLVAMADTCHILPRIRPKTNNMGRVRQGWGPPEPGYVISRGGQETYKKKLDVESYGYR